MALRPRLSPGVPDRIVQVAHLTAGYMRGQGGQLITQLFQQL